MVTTIAGIRFFEADQRRDILVVSPHSFVDKALPDTHPRKYRNDERTGIVAEALQERLGCHAAINDDFRKPRGALPGLAARRLDLYLYQQARQHPALLDRIAAVVDGNPYTLVLWLHGMADASADSQARDHAAAGLLDPAYAGLNGLIGYGQGPHPLVKTMKRPTAAALTSRYTARTVQVERFRDALTAHGLHTLIAKDDALTFRGRNPLRLNQWFRNQGYGFETVESIQLEIRKTGFRDTAANCRKTGSILAKAVMEWGSAAGNRF